MNAHSPAVFVWLRKSVQLAQHGFQTEAVAAGESIDAARGDFGLEIDARGAKPPLLQVRTLPRMRDLVPGANRRLLLRAMQLYGGFAELNYVFDSNRLLGEGLLSGACGENQHVGSRGHGPQLLLGEVHHIPDDCAGSDCA
jgi:hypothetical protein